MTSVTITPMQDRHRAALRAVRVGEDQVVFSGQPSAFVDLDLPQLDVHVILSNDAPVGMFRIDRDYHKHHRFSEPCTIGLRTFLIDQNHQGQGIAKTVTAQLRAYLAARYPAKTAVFLTVNLRNPSARHVYLSGGFIDTLAQYMGGVAGPQHILKLPLV